MATQVFFKCRNQILDSRSDVFPIVHVAICPKFAESPKILSPLVLRIFLVVVRSQKKKKIHEIIRQTISGKNRTDVVDVEGGRGARGLAPVLLHPQEGNSERHWKATCSFHT